jgi:hypothetical protein
MHVRRDEKTGLLQWLDPKSPIRRMLVRRPEMVSHEATDAIIAEEMAR